MSDQTYFILILGLLFVIGVMTTKFSSRIGVPALILYILVGVLVGSDGLGLFYFSDYNFAQLVGMLALVIILFEGGMQTKWEEIKPVIGPSISLATIGVLITTIIVAVAAKFILNVSWLEGFLFGAIVGSTDAAAVFAVLKGQNIKTRIESTLEAESGSNDPMAMILTISFIELLTVESASYWNLIGAFFWQMIMGLIIGLVIGKITVFAINKINLDSGGLYPVFALAFALLSFSVTDLMGASGLLAVYISAVLIGNSEIAYRHSIFRFNEGFAWIAQILMFTILGLLVYPSQILNLDIIGKGLLIALILIVVARPVAVFISTFKLHYSPKEQLFLSWAGLKGAVPIVLATFPMAAGLENAQLLFNVVFFVVLLSALVQGSTITILAEKLGLSGDKRPEPMHSLELVSIGKANAEIIEYEVDDDTAITNKSLLSITFPKDVLINAIIRNDQLVTPTGDTMIRKGDILYILVSKHSKKALKAMLKREV
ncbi:potassium/proton antiporter [Saliterribacillus persicus]|uniref:Potassium/proton antiporter (CPA1 family) n=1 Tax=Saliterribacillus persicus TaxID=930114 RepID=A0A368X3F0_9BACI|nr:potassium/proton antiporter [Saliterribacillus persicus]RCW62530.1 potassium/proton antiporter (CPA1 family) [Saliterribacillus persicus]